MERSGQRPIDFDSRINYLIKKRKSELANRIIGLKLKTIKALVKRYRDDGAQIWDIGDKTNTAYEKINGLCKNMLAITIIPTDKSEAVIAAILEDMFEKKKVIDDLIVRMKRLCGSAGRHIYQLEVDISKTLNFNYSFADVTAAQKVLKQLRDEVMKINEILPHVNNMCCQFLLTFEKALAKIKIVLDRL
ncbi:hypothetical protein AVEN_167977-1 [Araneus ventricosus]|uniref:Uncharacterized protein n=1 Tax=Araneus ventricosus TaxID=182803 RepID=A0A4Y2PSS0_ARAVE|nr:hypothetical protein AVEN_167977-1 [Araneus ventricosus]